MDLVIEQPCPSCGAPICIKEDCRLLRCEFCDMQNYRISQRLPRYVLPMRLPARGDPAALLYLPYLRFKGSIYICREGKVRHKLVDTTRAGGTMKNLPVSLGLRPQAMTVAPVNSRMPGRFVPQQVESETIFAEAARLTTLFDRNTGGRAVHRAFIGETVSRIYLPVYLYKGKMIDGITKRQLGNADLLADCQRFLKFDKRWEPRFLATHCPECGDGLQGGANSLVLHCTTCQTAWLEEQGRFVRVHYKVIRGPGREVTHLPFWHLQVEGRGAELSTLADLIELTNQPLVTQSRHRLQRLGFLIPAFKLNPNAFLHAAKNMTFLQLSFQEFRGTEAGNWQKDYPVTLPYPEAIQALKTVLAASAVNVRRVMKILPELQFVVKGVGLDYIPFRPSSHDWIEDNTGFSISAAALRFGHGL